jgi:CHAD domain-containing protein
VKARKVKGLGPDGPLVENACRTVLVRLDELHQFTPAVLDPADQGALHDMRIAAKRLRYLLELTGPCFGPQAARGAKVAKRLQTLLGDIHDCDEMLPRVEAHLDRLRSEDAAAVQQTGEEGAEDLDPDAGRAAAHGPKYRGLEALRAYLTARRAVLYSRFLVEWADLRHEGFRDDLTEEVREAAPFAVAA